MDLKTFCHSDKADSLKIDNTPSEFMAKRCEAFLLNAVDPLETLFYPAKINPHSGYRSTKLNTIVKGKTFSQHLRGNAIDFHVENFTLEQAYQTILNSSLKYDQCILEGRDGHQWIHFSYNTDLPESKQRMEHLLIPNP